MYRRGYYAAPAVRYMWTHTVNADGPTAPARIAFSMTGPRWMLRQMPTMAIDALAVAATYLLAVAVRTGARFDIPDPAGAVVIASAAGIGQVIANLAFHVYHRDWAVAALEDLVALGKATAAVVITLLAFNLAWRDHYLPFGAVLSGGAVVLVVEGVLRLRPRWPEIVRAAIGRPSAHAGAIVVGAGTTGQLLARLLSDPSRRHRIACFVDDDLAKRGRYVRGIRVAGTVDDLPALVRRHRAGLVIIAASAPSAALTRRVFDLCVDLDVRVRAVSGLGIGERDTSPLRAIGIDELLARGPADLDTPEARAFVRGRRVLITGAAGSIGSELARRAVALGADRVALLDMNENGLHELLLELGDAPVDLLLGDIRDRAWLGDAIARARPDILFHAAAYKHVPIVERHPLPGISTNVLGTANVLATAATAGVAHVVFISSDKAVHPENVLGLTKRFGELLTIATGRELARPYSVVRFGNVLGSSGSVVPIFERQIDRGGPITVTHEAAERYFMTIREAVGLVIEAAAIAGAGDLLVLEMGAPMRIVDLARRMVRLRGLRPDDIAITFIGLRPGEKLEERLFSADEAPVPTADAQLLRASASPTSTLADLRDALRHLEARIDAQDPSGAIEALRSAVRTAPTRSATGATPVGSAWR